MVAVWECSWVDETHFWTKILILGVIHLFSLRKSPRILKINHKITKELQNKFFQIYFFLIVDTFVIIKVDCVLLGTLEWWD